MDFLSTFTNYKQPSITKQMLEILEELCLYNDVYEVFTKDEDRIYFLWSVLSLNNNKGNIIFKHL